MRRSARKVNRFDQSLVRRLGALPETKLDYRLKRLTRSANHGVLWFSVATILASGNRRGRRAAFRGVAAIAGASASANLIGKRLFPRRRPAAELVPMHRRLSKRPTSSSFPSGHAASAAAFSTAVAMEHPVLGATVAPLAAAVAYSRVHTGVHWPSDVAAGTAIGVTAALATRHWWPLHPDVPAQTAHRADAPVMVDGVDMLVLVNPGSGDRNFDPVDLARIAWPSATFLYPNGNDIQEQLRKEIERRAGRVKALGVAGGDGTVAAVASVAAETGLPLALIPAGTLNHFARDVGVRSMRDADLATEAGSAVGIDLGEVEINASDSNSQRWFVNTASLGGYPEMVRLREKLEDRLPKWPAMVIATIRTLRHARPLRVLLNGDARLVWMVFVGNGTYAPKGFAPSARPALDTGLLDVRYLRADLPYSRARFVLAALTNSLNASHVYRQLDVAELTVELLDGNRRVATDGEVGPLGRHFRFRSRPSALTIYR
ncbi:undecaprenyl-diphosphatase [Herbihabitans rhizosphaerae]|uniref:Undecaprenyl-diphosphatase n=1 Tax=Herbihabitans rhizosphaerae TaxID=1872711 RepID=A0A4Q7L2X2_9PSEU|nr:undecaprenyl-diphosphatase [Herbihabitans rhizosphaerae]